MKFLTYLQEASETANPDELKTLLKDLKSGISLLETKIAKYSTVSKLKYDKDNESNLVKLYNKFIAVVPVAIRDNNLLDRVRQVVKRAVYTSQGTNKPSILQLGTVVYSYPGSPSSLVLREIDSFDGMRELLNYVNKLFNINCNHILINKYGTYKVALGAHQDNEAGIVPGTAVLTLSIGTRRRMRLSETRNGEYMDIYLDDNSILNMGPGCQENLFHSIQAGEGVEERGARYSITFREIIEPSPPICEPSPDSPISEGEFHDAQEDLISPIAPESQRPILPVVNSPPSAPRCQPITPDKILFIGSSLVRGIESCKFSREGKICTPVCLPGAHICKITNELIKLSATDCAKVSDLVVLGGGNNIQNQKDHQTTMREFDELCEVIGRKFSHSKVLIFNILPRAPPKLVKRKDDFKAFLVRFKHVNNYVRYLCGANGFRFVDCISHLTDGTGGLKMYSNEVLNERKGLFNPDCVHLSLKGTSVIAKVAMGIIYKPW